MYYDVGDKLPDIRGDGGGRYLKSEQLSVVDEHGTVGVGKYVYDKSKGVSYWATELCKPSVVKWRKPLVEPEKLSAMVANRVCHVLTPETIIMLDTIEEFIKNERSR